MLHAIYQLVAPRQFEIAFGHLDITADKLLVRPTYLSICHADQRYFQGNRPSQVLEQKLPMALIHEGIGQVVFDPTGQFSKGQRVVMIPNTPALLDDVVAENYLRSSQFRGSGFDGFTQELVAMAPDRLVSLPDALPNEVAAFTELVSVSHHAISRFNRMAHARRDKIGIWGDGNLAYITALLLRTLFPQSQLFVFGLDAHKLSGFSFADDTFLVGQVPKNLLLDHAFECVGGEGSAKAIAQMIDHLEPEATMALLGVSENPVPINTRMVLELGLRLFGSSRSGRTDFLETAQLFAQHPKTVGYLQNLVGEEFCVRSIADLTAAFESDAHKAFGKTVINWQA